MTNHEELMERLKTNGKKIDTVNGYLVDIATTLTILTVVLIVGVLGSMYYLNSIQNLLEPPKEEVQPEEVIWVQKTYPNATNIKYIKVPFGGVDKVVFCNNGNSHEIKMWINGEAEVTIPEKDYCIPIMYWK